jgi:hypothetical protein
VRPYPWGPSPSPRTVKPEPEGRLDNSGIYPFPFLLPSAPPLPPVFILSSHFPSNSVCVSSHCTICSSTLLSRLSTTPLRPHISICRGPVIFPEPAIPPPLLGLLPHPLGIPCTYPLGRLLLLDASLFGSVQTCFVHLLKSKTLNTSKLVFLVFAYFHLSVCSVHGS